MAAITSAIIGAGAAGFGLFNMFSGNAKSEEGYAQMAAGAYKSAEGAKQQTAIAKASAAYQAQSAASEFELNKQGYANSLEATQKSTAISKEIIGLEQGVQAQKKQAMEIDARRSQMEIIRNQQRARAMGLAAATSQGAQGGSGLQGGYGQVSGQAGTNILGVQQNLEIGRNIFGLNESISNKKIQGFDLELEYATKQAQLGTAKSTLLYQNALAQANFNSQFADAGSIISQGQYTSSLGQGMVGMGTGQSQLGASLLSAGSSIFSAGTNFAKINPSFGSYSAFGSGFANLFGSGGGGNA